MRTAWIRNETVDAFRRAIRAGIILIRSFSEHQY